MPSLQTSHHGFRCTATEPSLSDCIETLPDSTRCQHLAVTCAKDGPVTPITADDSYSSVADNHLNGGSASSHADSSGTPFSIVGVVVGVLSALLLVGVAVVVGMVIGVALWWKSRGKSAVVKNQSAQPA